MYYDVKTGDSELDAFARGASVFRIACCEYDLFVHPETESFPSDADRFRKTIAASEFGYLVQKVVSMGKKNPRVIPQFISEISMFPVILNTACSYSSSGLLLVDFPRIDAVEVRFDRGGGTLEKRIVNHFRSTSSPQVVDKRHIITATRREIPYNVVKGAVEVNTALPEAVKAAHELVLKSAFGHQGCSALIELSKHFNVAKTSNAGKKKAAHPDLAMYAATEQPRDPYTRELRDDFVTPLAIFGARGHQLSIDFTYSGCECATYSVLRRWRS